MIFFMVNIQNIAYIIFPFFGLMEIVYFLFIELLRLFLYIFPSKNSQQESANYEYGLAHF